MIWRFKGGDMTDKQLLDRIAVNPKVMTGKPVIKGTRLTVEYVCGCIARGATVADLCAEYEGLTSEDILACLWYPRELPSAPGVTQPYFFDLGHQGDVDYTQIIQSRAMTPEELLERHEGWRLFLQETQDHVALRNRHDRQAGTGPS
jgi:uncharacterized protein (DUF433 family)